MNKRTILGGMALVAGAGWLVWKLTRPDARPVRHVDPVLSDLLTRYAGRIDWADGWALSIPEGETDDPVEWAHAVLTSQSGFVGRLMRLRDALMRPLGLGTMTDRDVPYTGFPLLEAGDLEIVLGIHDKHLNFHVGVDTHDHHLTLTTTVTINNWIGKLYWSVVRWFHPVVVSAVLRHAQG